MPVVPEQLVDLEGGDNAPALLVDDAQRAVRHAVRRPQAGGEGVVSGHVHVAGQAKPRRLRE